jgi:hypothetical protein
VSADGAARLFLGRGTTSGKTHRALGCCIEGGEVWMAKLSFIDRLDGGRGIEAPDLIDVAIDGDSPGPCL